MNFYMKLPKVPGIYVPSLYEVTYKEDGTIASFEPIYEDVPKHDPEADRYWI